MRLKLYLPQTRQKELSFIRNEITFNGFFFLKLFAQLENLPFAFILSLRFYSEPHLTDVIGINKSKGKKERMKKENVKVITKSSSFYHLFRLTTNKK